MTTRVSDHTSLGASILGSELMATAAEHEVKELDDKGSEHAQRYNQKSPSSKGLPKRELRNVSLGKETSNDQEVTDPVTRMPVTIYDMTKYELDNAFEEMPSTRTAKLPESSAEKNENQPPTSENLQNSHIPPTKEILNRNLHWVIFTGPAVLLASTLIYAIRMRHRMTTTSSDNGWKCQCAATLSLACVASFLMWGFTRWLEDRVNNLWAEKMRNSESKNGGEGADTSAAESTRWLNSLLASIWGLVNPSMFASLAETLEDSMQANLPRMVNMIKVEELGQGSEAPHILGVRRLTTKAKSQEQDTPTDRQQSLAEIVAAEEGNSVSFEVTFAYQARPTTSSLRTKAKNAHIFLVLYLLAGIRLPVWVEIRGIVGIVRLRLQLTPDPPFLAEGTFTFIGQPKISLSCTPVFKHGLNIMNLPVISSFVQDSVDSAIATYVAPKSLTLDLKDIIMGDDFKKDTSAYGVVVIRIHSATGLQGTDNGMFGSRNEPTAPYVAVSWTKYKRPLWRSRTLASQPEPIWDETGYILLGPDQWNAEEKLRLQLWDSGQSTSDGNLGFVDVGLDEVMRATETLDRRDTLYKPGDNGHAPQTLLWSLGYFPKTRIPRSQLVAQADDRDVKNIDELEEKVAAEAVNKLRESSKNEPQEVEKQKEKDIKVREDAVIISSPPSPGYPSGIFSIHIHQILGLEFEKAKRDQNAGAYEEEGQMNDDDLLSSYCTIIINHQRVFRTRTKPKSEIPTFNIGTEQFIRDWQNTQVILAVHDSRVHEHDPLVGIVLLPLFEVFKYRSQINDYYSLSGGSGYGRIRISMVFRSTFLQMPKELLGWEYGTLQLTNISTSDLPNRYQAFELRLHTSSDSDKMVPAQSNWSSRSGQPVNLAIQQRYCSSLVIRFQGSGPMHYHCLAFAVVWLKEIPDNIEWTIKLPVWKGDSQRAETSCRLDDEENVGHITVRLVIRPGISRRHQSLGKKDKNMEDIVSVLNAVDEDQDRLALEEAAFEGQTELEVTRASMEGASDSMTVEKPKGRLYRANRKVMRWKDLIL